MEYAALPLGQREHVRAFARHRHVGEIIGRGEDAEIALRFAGRETGRILGREHGHEAAGLVIARGGLGDLLAEQRIVGAVLVLGEGVEGLVVVEVFADREHVEEAAVAREAEVLFDAVAAIGPHGMAVAVAPGDARRIGADVAGVAQALTQAWCPQAQAIDTRGRGLQVGELVGAAGGEAEAALAARYGLARGVDQLGLHRFAVGGADIAVAVLDPASAA
ncbi:MAG: hypothetical protein ACOCYP_09750 [Planctomycetota bacterium]